VGVVTAIADHDTAGDLPARIHTYAAVARAGFRRYATYRQATVAGAVTNTVFGFLRTYVLLAVAAGAGGVAAGYQGDQLVTYVWFGQGLLAVVFLWGWTDLADRVRTGEVATDLLRPIHPVALYLAGDLGRAGHAVLFRFVPPVVVGALVFDLYLPSRAGTWPLFVLSTGLAVVVCFGLRFLINTAAYWLLDLRGVMSLWGIGAPVLGGLYFPLRFLPDWLAVTLYVASPFASVLQIPLDVLVERDPLPVQLAMIGVQLIWAVLLLVACWFVQRRAERRLVIQGG
jgi:ABC-2 type transport system permease protein